MAIGKPLLVNQRRDVERAVMSAQTQQLSSNVPAQKINFMSYDIGQANAKASRAVPDELLNMVNKGLEAKLYMDNTKREFKRLSLMEDWQKSNMDFQGRFAQARTPDAQATVIADYENETQNRIGEYTESQGKGVKQQAQLADLKNTANTQFSKFSVTHQNNVFKQTASMYETDTATIAQSVAEDVNTDPVSAFKKIADNYADMVGIGALTAPAAAYQQGLLQDKMITARSGLFATNYAKDILAEGRDLPSDKEFKTQINGVMGLELDERRLKLASRAFTDTYYKELKAFNSQVAAEDAHNKEAISEDLAAFEAEYKEEILDKLLTPERKEELINKAKQFDGVEDGYSGRIKVLLDAVQFGTSSQIQVDEFTVGQAGLDLQAVLHAGGKAGHGVDYYDLEAVEYAARNAGGAYAGMNENTILGIVKHYRNENAKLVTEFSKRTPLLLKTNMVAAMQNTEIFLQSDEAGMGEKFWNAIKATSALNWESVFSQDLEYGKAFARVQSVLKQAAISGTGKGNPFSKEEIGDDVPARTEALNSFIQQTIVTEFGAATAQKRDRVQAAKDKRAEAQEKFAEGKVSRDFTMGGVTKDKKQYPGALEVGAKQLQSSIKAQKEETYNQITERLQAQLVNPNVEKLKKLTPYLLRDRPSGIEVLEKNKAAIVETLTTFGTMELRGKFVQSMADNKTARKNSRLLRSIEEDIGRKATPEEIAGDSPKFNALAQGKIDQAETNLWDAFWNSDNLAQRDENISGIALELRRDSAEKMQRGIDSNKPVAPTSEGLPVAEATPKPLPRSPVEQLSEVISNVLAPSDAEASSGNFDPTATGPRGFDAEGNPVYGTRDELASNVGLPPEYKLQSGDTLSGIAQQAGTTVEELQILNPQTVGRENSLQIGDPILLPQGSNAMPSVASPMQDSGQQPVGVPDPMAFDNDLMSVGQETPQAQQPENYLEEFILKREGTPQDAIADVGSGIDADGVGYGHIATAADKRLWNGLTTEQRKIQARDWLAQDMAKSSRGAEKQLAELGRTPSSANAQGLKDMLTFMNFQLGEAWHTKKFKKAWAGLKRGNAAGEEGMFRGKTGWEQAIYHLMHTNESSNTPSKWLQQTPKRVMDAVMSLHYMSDGNGTEDIIGYIDSILQDIP